MATQSARNQAEKRAVFIPAALRRPPPRIFAIQSAPNQISTLACVTSTGRSLSPATPSATLPRNMCRNPRRPWVPITMASEPA